MEKFKIEPVSGGYVTLPATNEHPLLCLLHNGEPFGEVGSLCQFDSVETFVPHLRSVAKQYGLAIEVVWRRGPNAILRILHEESTIPKKAVDLSAQLDARGIPLSAWVMPDGSILTGLPSHPRVLGNTVKRRGRPTSQQIASALNVITVLFGDLKRTYFNREDFLSKQGVDTPYEWGRCLYKATACRSLGQLHCSRGSTRRRLLRRSARTPIERRADLVVFMHRLDHWLHRGRLGCRSQAHQLVLPFHRRSTRQGHRRRRRRGRLLLAAR